MLSKSFENSDDEEKYEDALSDNRNTFEYQAPTLENQHSSIQIDKKEPKNTANKTRYEKKK